MIVDTSALIAILRSEADSRRFTEALEAARVVRISAANYVEAAAVIDASRDPVMSRRLDGVLTGAKAIIEPFTVDQARVARAAYRDFGKGSGHPARLNLGDCFSYALAKVSDEPLLYKGSDFLFTDIASVLPPASS